MEEPSSHNLPVASTVPPSHLPSAALPASQANPLPASEYTAIIIGWILQGGVILSATVILIGMLLLLLHADSLSVHSLQVFPHSLDQVWVGLLVLQPQAVIALGLLLLIATPVVRVAVSVVAFAIEHDRRYVIITLIVLAILVASFLVGKGGG